MYTATIENKNGEVLVLTGKEPIYQVIKILGLDPPQAQINLTTIVGMDGARFNSAKLETRNVVLTVKINGDVERNRLDLYRYFRTKEWCRFRYLTETRNVFIDGYVENIECDLYSNAETAQISIICPDPYFRSAEEYEADLSAVMGLFTFPFSINYNEPIPFSEIDESRTTTVVNESESETGLTITARFEEAASALQLIKKGPEETLTLVYTFYAGDILRINTQRGHKAITLTRAGATRNLFSALQEGSTFLQLDPGVNEFSYLVSGAAAEGVQVSMNYRNVYRGV